MPRPQPTTGPIDVVRAVSTHQSQGEPIKTGRSPLEVPLPGRSLPGAFYTDEDLFVTELARFHLSDWVFAGHTVEIPQVGDYLTYDVGPESIIVVREADSSCRAFHNVCRHRGSRVCTARAGNKRRFICPYHSWTYDLDGRLVAARQMPPTFDRAAHGLRSAGVVEFGGLIFVSFSELPPSFERPRSDAEPRLAPYSLDRTKVAAKHSYVVDANWKIIAENFRECYHCGPAHPEYCRAIVGATVADSRAREEEAAAALAEQRPLWAELGLDEPDIDFGPGSVHLLQRFAYRKGYLTQSVHGRPVAPLLGRLRGYQSGVLAFTVRPNFWMEVTADHAVTMRHTPISAAQTEVQMTWLVRDDAVAGCDYRPEEVSEFWRVTGEQDWTICRNTQAGVRSRFYRPGPLAPSERATAEWIEWYLARMGMAAPNAVGKVCDD